MQQVWIDRRERTVGVAAFRDPELFRLEQQRVFQRSWLYVGHRSQIPQPGDFVQSRAGLLPLLLCQDGDGEFQALVNVCAHRGARVCALESGHAERFTCPYHSWTYDNRGQLVGVPRQGSADFDRCRWGLRRAPRVECHGDLIFASFDEQAPPLAQYLGEFRWYLELLTHASRAGTEVSAGSHRSQLHCNWKIPAEQFGTDNWHFQAVHGSIALLGRRNENPQADDSFHVWTPEGHCLICIAPRTEVPTPYGFYLDELLRSGQIDERQRRLLRCTLVMTVFPNLSLVYFPGMCSLRVWQPLAAGQTELWSWALANRDLPEALKQSNRQQVTRLFSPTGMLEQDDLEVWARLGANMAALPDDFRFCYAFDAPQSPLDPSWPGNTARLQSDRAAFAFYERWASLMETP